MAGKSVPAGAEPSGKAATDKDVTQIVMSAAALVVKGEAAVSADNSRIERQSVLSWTFTVRRERDDGA